MPDPDASLSFFARFWFAWSCLVRILADGAFAARVLKAQSPVPQLPEPRPPEPKAPAPEPVAQKPEESALQLLALLQREGRLVDFLEQDVASFSDADIGAAARVVHDGCAKALRAHVTITPIRPEDEGAAVTLPEGFRPTEVKLSGDVKGSAPYRGVVRHRGWRAADLALPTPVKGHDSSILAPAEVEL